LAAVDVDLLEITMDASVPTTGHHLIAEVAGMYQSCVRWRTGRRERLGYGEVHVLIVNEQANRGHACLSASGK